MEDPTFIELHEYRKAVEQEFTALNINPDDTPDELRTKARTFAVNHLSSAFDALSDLLTSSKDATRLSAAKAIISIAMQTSPTDESNPIEQLFNKLSISTHPDPDPDPDTPTSENESAE
jgi:hypothetical protein